MWGGFSRVRPLSRGSEEEDEGGGRRSRNPGAGVPVPANQRHVEPSGDSCRYPTENAQEAGHGEAAKVHIPGRLKRIPGCVSYAKKLPAGSVASGVPAHCRLRMPNRLTGCWQQSRLRGEHNGHGGRCGQQVPVGASGMVFIENPPPGSLDPVNVFAICSVICLVICGKTGFSGCFLAWLLIAHFSLPSSAPGGQIPLLFVLPDVAGFRSGFESVGGGG